MPARTMKLPCKLTDEGRVTWANQLAEALKAKRELEARKKDQARKLKIQIDARQSEIDQLQEELTEGSYLTEVVVREEKQGNTIVTIRVDTGEIVAKRSPTISEQEAEQEEEQEEETAKPAKPTNGRRRKKAAKKPTNGRRKKREPDESPEEEDADDTWDRINRAAELSDGEE